MLYIRLVILIATVILQLATVTPVGPVPPLFDANGNVIQPQPLEVLVTTVPAPAPGTDQAKYHVKNLLETLTNVLSVGNFQGAADTIRLTLDHSLHGIRNHFRAIFQGWVDKNLMLVQAGGPGRVCVEEVIKTVLNYMNFMIAESFFNTNKFREMNWSLRQAEYEFVVKLIVDEICALDKQLAEIIEDAVKDMNRFSLVGFGLTDTHEINPRLGRMREECKKVIDALKTPYSLGIDYFRNAIPATLLVTAIRAMAPPPVRNIAYRLGQGLGQVLAPVKRAYHQFRNGWYGH